MGYCWNKCHKWHTYVVFFLLNWIGATDPSALNTFWVMSLLMILATFERRPSWILARVASNGFCIWTCPWNTIKRCRDPISTFGCSTADYIVVGSTWAKAFKITYNTCAIINRTQHMYVQSYHTYFTTVITYSHLCEIKFPGTTSSL